MKSIGTRLPDIPESPSPSPAKRTTWVPPHKRHEHAVSLLRNEWDADEDEAEAHNSDSSDLDSDDDHEHQTHNLKSPSAAVEFGSFSYSRAKDRKTTKKRPMHASLTAAWAAKDASESLGYVPQTIGMQRNGEAEYRSRRLVHDSPVMVVPHEVHSKKDREVVKFWDGTTQVVRQMCMLRPCNLMSNETHMERFFHPCKYGAICPRQKNRQHCQYFTHPEKDSEQEAGKTRWQIENMRSPQCIPTLAADRYHAFIPAYSFNPRGGHRPRGGHALPADLVDEGRKSEIVRDQVVLRFHGLDTRWDSASFFEFVRSSVGAVLILKAHVVDDASTGKPSGGGLVTVQSYADAESVRKALHNKPVGGTFNFFQITYNDVITHPEFDQRQERSKAIGLMQRNGVVDPAVRRFNRHIRACGPYYLDAEAVVTRMKDEGHKPDATSCVYLMRSYCETDPPQAARAMVTMERMRQEGVPITTSACNYIVKAWCKAGNMRKAEELVKEMETDKWPLFPNGKWRGEYMPLPDEATYIILRDGWASLGIMEDVAERQRGFKFDEENVSKSLGGVPGSSLPAPSVMTTWGRRRSGYMPIHSGNFVSMVDPDMKMGNLYVLRKWRDRS